MQSHLKPMIVRTGERGFSAYRKTVKYLKTGLEKKDKFRSFWTCVCFTLTLQKARNTRVKHQWVSVSLLRIYIHKCPVFGVFTVR